MTEAERYNAILERECPAAFLGLSPLGLRAAMPLGIPVQATEAKNTEINATIGQVTDGRGGALPLPFLAEQVSALDVKQSFLYAPVDGHAALRTAWLQRQRSIAESSIPLAPPVMTHGLTHCLAILADLFADPDTDVILPDPCWENYELLFQLHTGARIASYPFFAGGEINLEGLRATLAATAPGRKALVVLNIPGNPTGYTPPETKARELVAILLAHPGPLVVIVDDAYQGTTWETGLMARSLFWPLAEKADPRKLLVFKVDGATKELFFFPSRVGFLTHNALGAAAEALHSKMCCVIRASVGCPPGPSQAMVAKALADPRLAEETASRLEVLRSRYRALKLALDASSSVLLPYPFNSAYFALVGFQPGVDANAVRLRLIRDHGVGTIYVPSINALRLAYCSVSEDQIGELVARLQAAVRAVAA